MDNVLTNQLAELVKACNRKDIYPIVCGGLGVYLNFREKKGEIASMIRVTQDIDLMFCRQDLLEEAKRKAMAEIITRDLEYVVQDAKKYHGFKKGANQELDILVPPMESLPQKNYRHSIVKSTLHGHITEEAEFIDEDLKTVSLSDVSGNEPDAGRVILHVPSATNLMMMKLHAFRDRFYGDRKDSNRATAHAFDIYIIIMLTDRNDLKQAQSFLERHGRSAIVKKAVGVVENSFAHYEKAGWQTVLSSPNFYPALRVVDKEEKLKQAAARLLRWFGVKAR